MNRNHAPLDRVALWLLAPLLFSFNGCVTTSLWNELPKRHSGSSIDWGNGRTVSAIALTPVTVAVDAALIAGYLWLLAEDDDCCCDCDWD